NLGIVTLGEGGSRTEVLFDHHGPGAKDAPHPIPAFPLPEDCWDGDGAIVYSSPLGTTAVTIRLDLTNKTWNQLKLPEVKKDDGPALDTYIGRRQQQQRLTPPGNLFLRERNLAESKVVDWRNDQGQRIEGVLTLPPAGDARPPYKLIVYPHGGPHGR